MNCSECKGPMDEVRVFDGTDDDGELMDRYCPECDLGVVEVPDLGHAEVER